jgi:hypothetical protein
MACRDQELLDDNDDDHGSMKKTFGNDIEWTSFYPFCYVAAVRGQCLNSSLASLNATRAYHSLGTIELLANNSERHYNNTMTGVLSRPVNSIRAYSLLVLCTNQRICDHGKA